MAGAGLGVSAPGGRSASLKAGAGLAPPPLSSGLRCSGQSLASLGGERSLQIIIDED